MTKMVEFSKRIETIHNLGIKNPKALNSKLYELGCVYALPVNYPNGAQNETRTGRIIKLEVAINDILLTLEGKEPKTVVLYADETSMTYDALNKRAVSIDVSQNEINVLKAEYDSRILALQSKIANARKGVPVSQQSELRLILGSMEHSRQVAQLRKLRMEFVRSAKIQRETRKLELAKWELAQLQTA